jgi:hypothetical protein
MEWIMKFITDILTGLDGETHDIARWSWVASMLTLFAATLHVAWSKGAVDLAAFGTAVATIVAGHGAAIWAKKDTEPK